MQGYWKTHPLVEDVYTPLCGGPNTMGQGTTDHSMEIDEWAEYVELFSNLRNI